jgi:chromosome partitioning protein
MTLPRVASGRCKVAAVGMRLDARTKSAEVLQAWADQHKLPFVGVLRETQAYVRCIEQGLTLFDLPAAQVQGDMAQWKPILEWLAPVLNPAEPAAAVAAVALTRPSPKPVRQVPAPPAQAEPRERRSTAHRFGGLLAWLPMLRFLQRKPTSNAFAGSAL